MNFVMAVDAKCRLLYLGHSAHRWPGFDSGLDLHAGHLLSMSQRTSCARMNELRNIHAAKRLTLINMATRFLIQPYGQGFSTPAFTVVFTFMLVTSFPRRGVLLARESMNIGMAVGVRRRLLCLGGSAERRSGLDGGLNLHRIHLPSISRHTSCARVNELRDGS
jgi:hypothetical protein